MIKKIFFRGMALVMAALLAGMPVSAMAKVEEEIILSADGIEDYMAESEKRRSEPVNTNKIQGWPEGPSVTAAGAIAMDADSGEILYGKNITKHLYPASITKLMTGLLAYENLSPDDTITFSYEAVHTIEQGSSHIGIKEGESLTFEEAMYALMVASANEVANGLGESVSGSQEAFADLMNERAKELGCRDTHFVTLNGLHDEDHYTCVYDMALISREAFSHPELVEYMSKKKYNIKPTKNQPDDIWMYNTDRFFNDDMKYDGFVAGKTGYTDQSRQTLVTLAERDGKRLICVVMKAEPPYQYYDTMEILDYAFDKFRKVNVSEEEKRFTLSSPPFLSFGKDIFGDSSPAYRIPDGTTLMLPEDVSLSDLDAKIVPCAISNDEPEKEADEAAGKDGTAEKAQAAGEVMSGAAPERDPNVFTKDGSRLLGTVYYSYHGYDLTSAQVVFSPTAKAGQSAFVPEEVHGIKSIFFGLVHTGLHGSIYLNILFLIPLVLAAAFALCIVFYIRSYYEDLEKKRRRSRRKAPLNGKKPPQGRRKAPLNGKKPPQGRRKAPDPGTRQNRSSSRRQPRAGS